MKEWKTNKLNEQINKQMIELVNEWMNERMKSQMNDNVPPEWNVILKGRGQMFATGFEFFTD